MIRKMTLLERAKLMTEIAVVAVVVPFSGRYRHIMRAHLGGLVQKFEFGHVLGGYEEGDDSE